MKNVQYINGRRVVTNGTPVPFVKTAATSEEVWDAFTAAEQELLAGHANAKVQAFIRTLQIKRSVPLAKLQTALNALETAGLLAVGRAAEIYNAVD